MYKQYLQQSGDRGADMSETKKVRRIYCNRCKTNTHHELLGSHEYHFGGDEGEPHEWGEYKLWACAGCDTCTMEDHYTADYMMDNEGENVFESLYFPKRGYSVRSSKHFAQLPTKLQQLYREVMSSFNEDLHLLCAVGLRSLVEGVCAQKGIPGGSLEARVEGMKSLLPENIVKHLHEFRFMGNKAVHELEAPKTYELTVAIDVIEDILNFLYALDYKASMLGKLRASQRETEPAATASASRQLQPGRSQPAEAESIEIPKTPHP